MQTTNKTTMPPRQGRPDAIITRLRLVTVLRLA